MHGIRVGCLDDEARANAARSPAWPAPACRAHPSPSGAVERRRAAARRRRGRRTSTRVAAREAHRRAEDVARASPMVAATSVAARHVAPGGGVRPANGARRRRWSSRPNQRRCGGLRRFRIDGDNLQEDVVAETAEDGCACPSRGCAPPAGGSTPSTSRTHATPVARSGATTAMWSSSVICARSGRRPRGPSSARWHPSTP